MKKKTTGQLIKQLQPIFNKYIRLRDEGKPCISCGEYKEEMDAGHFWAKSGYSGLRFDEDNTHAECKYCNRFDESHLIGYAENLKQKIGELDYKQLKERAEEYKRNGVKWNRAELEEKINYYKNKVKILLDKKS